MPLADQVLATIRRHAMLCSGGRVLVGLSGGPDSVGLLHLLRELEARGELTVSGAAHLNHGLRADADADEAFCKSLASDLGIPLIVERADVASLSRSWRTSLEDAGRRARYAFFDRAAAATESDRLATGHTADDQAETFLLQLIRGAGPRGLSAIAPARRRICRPLIELRRDAVREWLDARGFPFRVDPSNADPTFTRNRVRHRLLPLLKAEFSPAIVGVLAREAAIARDDEDHLQGEAIEVARSVVLASEHDVAVDAAALRCLHPAIASRVARIAMAVLAPQRYAGFAHVQRLLALARQPEASALSLPGQQAWRRGDRIVLQRRRPVGFANSFRVPLSIPGEVLLEPQGWAVSADISAEPPSQSSPAPLTAAVRAGAVALPLAVRSRRRGDRLRPAGMGGRQKKLQDLFVDRKIARELRDSVPLVVDSDDRILWVVGQAVAEDFRVTAASQGVLLLKARRLGGLG
jgi:tRNA(Ile)-lysidine synthase